MALGFGETRVLFTNTAIILGLVYGYLPFMVLPLYAAIERIDWSFVEGARDLYASGWSAFRRVVWPLAKPGVIAGSILVFVPSFGAYVTPAILGGNKQGLLGSYIVLQFLSARNGPVGSALSVVVLGVMLVGTLVYFRSGGRNL
jgi:spermidine/putrescine transport system permease protein